MPPDPARPQVAAIMALPGGCGVFCLHFVCVNAKFCFQSSKNFVNNHASGFAPK
jgi:hypothetical protein